MASKFLNLTSKVLKEAKQPMTIAEIWAFAVEKGYDQELGKTGKTPFATLGAQCYVEVRDNPASDLVVIENTKPKKFFLRSLGHIAEKPDTADKQIIAPPSKYTYLEKQLHPFLVYFASRYMHLYLKTINQSTSSKREFGEWVHPDIVGCHFYFEDWQPEVAQISSAAGNQIIKLYSFELKRELSFGNLREAFFQAVSNSSWANEGYLVAENISQEPEFHSELTRLSSAFGIGVIDIDIEDPDATAIVYPARQRELVDWETVDKLSTLNPDFRGFLAQLKKDVTAGDVNNSRYDKLLSAEELIKSISNCT